ncbi:tetratricopeptide repeat-containing protein [Thermodesulfovibrio aggregans]|uniref:Tetratricopeptide repeat-containing protein n=1 Tax=Thermodesulfovibrio aggregans TaxID=86166 RepID=A0A0U9HNV9_9BACT|nr:tetratricopeptide repeat protein [Thermodesulfovibrio aggregans]GAQ94683.1 tetratricopeptide repeat-containing protein [Thermodesulfovibrio aggregans]
MKDRLKITITFSFLFFLIISGCYRAPVEQPFIIKELNSLILQANKAFQRGEIERAKNLYNEALKKSRLIQDDNATAIILISLSRLYSSESEIGEAKKFIDTAMELSKKALLPENTIEELDFERARVGFLLNEDVQELLKKLSLSKFNNIKIKSLNLLARLKIRQNNYEEADRLLQHALEINQKIDKIEEANTLRLLGEIYSTKNQKQAESYFLKALEIDREIANPQKIALDMETLGRFYKNTGDKKKAKEYFIRAIEVWKALGKEEVVMKIEKELEP